jgi:hypothetical protein
VIGLALVVLLGALQDEPKELKDAEPVRDRWRIPFPDYPLNEPGNGIDPYYQNTLKGDYPILGQNIFAAITARSDTVLETRKLPTPSGVSTERAGSFDFFGDDEQLFFQQDFAGTIEIFKGETAFRPRDWEIRVTGVMNFNYVELEELNAVNPNPDEGKDRPDHRLSVQEFVGEYHLFDVSSNYDFVSVRAGIQPFVSDFRASSAPSPTTASSGTSSPSTSSRRTRTASSTRCTGASSRSTSPTSTSRISSGKATRPSSAST